MPKTKAVLLGTPISLAMLLAVSLLPTTSKALEQLNEITWAINAAPPFHVVRDPYARQGICDVLVSALELEMTDIKHEKRLLPHPRVSNLITNKENMCFPCMIHNADNEYVVFSNPTHVYRPHGIITNHRIAQELKERFGDNISLTEVLATERYRFGQPVSRKYGQLQPLIADYATSTKLHINISGDDNNIALLSMIMEERLDFTIDYDITKRYYELTTNKDLVFLPLSENSNQPIVGAIGCTANDWGRKAVAEINKALPAVLQRDEFLDILDFWFNSEMVTDYWQYYDQGMN
ncbi:MAG: hypothetical protein WEA82_01940 [Idiomarina sp.]